MNVLDIILGSLILLGLIRGLMRGLFVELASITALIVGVYGAIHFSDYAAAFLENRVAWEEKYINIIAFAITFVILVLAIALAGKALTKLADFAALGIINKLLGALFGALKIGFILSIVLIIFNRMNKTIPFLDDNTLESSVLYAPIKSLVPMIFPSIEDIEEEMEEENVII
ncbi:CvpA family protein [Yeosuana sp. MJ-SS3]|uniref:CvpA family protein n=1 Tax=Gilvirhabdus luticola TaxID=3079858 RepID=A0ABU3U2Z9_9FLAO|nr:CvpA family protein [Yeosuana sp. MJ-SS3]MDU8884791.1 CvpA family protein [Yeosuana sp. MJ-SS3]